MFHEFGHRCSTYYNVPVFGREEDAADQISAFVMLQFGKQIALTTIRGVGLHLPELQEFLLTRTEFADEHGAPDQRFFNYLCLAYGGHPEAFKEDVEQWRPAEGSRRQVPLSIARSAAPSPGRSCRISTWG